MRHRRRGRKLGRNPNHQRALLRNLASALFLTERDAEDEDNSRPRSRAGSSPRCRRPRRSARWSSAASPSPAAPCPTRKPADELEPNAERNSEHGGPGGSSERWQEWNQTIAPVVAARRRALRLLGDKQAVRILFDEHCPPLRRSRRRLHPRAAAGQAPPGRRRHAGRSSSSSARTTASAARPPGRRSRSRKRNRKRKPSRSSRRPRAPIEEPADTTDQS